MGAPDHILVGDVPLRLQIHTNSSHQFFEKFAIICFKQIYRIIGTLLYTNYGHRYRSLCRYLEIDALPNGASPCLGYASCTVPRRAILTWMKAQSVCQNIYRTVHLQLAINEITNHRLEIRFLLLGF